MKKLFFSLLLLVIAGNVMAGGKTAKVGAKCQCVIFDTDMGNDVDDVLALDMLYKYMDAEKINLLAIMTNKNGAGSARFLDIMNTWYGYPNIPIGIVRNGAKCDNTNNYAQIVSDMKVDGKPMFRTTVPDVTKLPDAEKLYRKVLARQPDHSVVIISTGFSTNLARLLDTKGDAYSPLSGRELMARKVQYLSLMAGSFKGLTEYNVVTDIPACAKLFAESPVPIVTSPFELGETVKYPGQSIQNDFSWAPLHPLVKAFESYLPMPYDRPTWDPTAVLQVLEPGKFMTKSAAGNIFVDAEGHTYYKKSLDGKDYYLTITPEQGEKIKNFFVSVVTKKPKNKR